MAAKTIPELTETTTLAGTGLIPVDSGIQSFKMTLANLFKAGKSFLFSSSPQDNTNISLSASVASNALTIALKTKGGTNASATDPITVGFRNSTLTNGTYNTREITAALSLVISSGSTLGHTSGVASPIYVYLIDNAGTPELAVSTTLFDTAGVITTVAEGGAGAADSIGVMYSQSARSSVPFRFIGKLGSTQTTAGTWAAAPTLVTTTMLDQPASSLMGITSGIAAAAGVVSEVYRVGFTGGNLTSPSAGRAAIITLPSPGNWIVFFQNGFSGTATSCTRRQSCANLVDVFSNTRSATVSASESGATVNLNPIAEESQHLQPLIINSSTPPVIYIWGAAIFTGGTCNQLGYVTAFRIG